MAFSLNCLRTNTASVQELHFFLKRNRGSGYQTFFELQPPCPPRQHLLAPPNNFIFVQMVLLVPADLFPSAPPPPLIF